MAEQTEHRPNPSQDASSNVVRYTTDVSPNDMIDPWWAEQVLRHAYSDFLSRQWAIDVEDVEPELIDTRLPDDLRLLRRGSLLNSGRVQCVIGGDDAMALLQLTRGNLWVGVAGADLARARGLLDAVVAAFPVAQAGPEEHVVHIGLWVREQAHRAFRAIEVSSWDDVRDNYAAPTHDQIAPLMAEGFSPDGRGQLIVWSGPPGTGKSYALGSLAYAWRAWAQFCFIADPETLLHDAGYLMEFLVSRPPLDDRWRIGVLEDTGGLLVSDARRQGGQGIGSLLNATDGMLGQHSKTMFVITTNEPVERFHDAVTRPGRCASRVSFDPLPTEQAKQWLLGRGHAEVAKRLTCSATIAELYAFADGLIEPERPSAAVGAYL